MLCFSAVSQATPGEDYIEVEQQELLFNSEVSFVCIPVYVRDDDILEYTEVITFNLRVAVEDIAIVNVPVEQATVYILEESDGNEENHWTSVNK